MKNKIFVSLFIAAIAIVSGINAFYSFKSNVLSDIVLAKVEALADDESIGDWWDRCDYDCISVTCQCFIYTSQSTVAKYVGDGLGTVPHTWSCVGCGDCGWTVN